MPEETRSGEGRGDAITEETPDAYRDAWEEYVQDG